MQHQGSSIGNLNREAIRLFRTGRHETGRRILVMAISDIRNESDDSNEQGAQPVVNDSSATPINSNQPMIVDNGNTTTTTNPLKLLNNQDLLSSQQEVTRIHHDARVTTTTVTAVDNYQQEEYFLHFNKAFLFDGNIQMIPHEEQDAVGALLLYNLALFYHQIAIQYNKSPMYKKAIYLYNQSYEIACDASRATLSYRNTLQIVAACCLHNISHCYLLGQCNKLMSITYQDELTNLLQSIDITTEDCNNKRQCNSSEVDDNDDIIEFLSSSSFMAKSQLYACNVASAA